MFVIRADQGGFGERLALLVVARADRDLALPVDEHAVAQAAAGAAPLGNLLGDGFVTVADHVGLVGNVRHHAARPRSNCCDAIGSVFQVMGFMRITALRKGRRPTAIRANGSCMSSQTAAEFGYSASSPSGLGAVGGSDSIGCRPSPVSGSTPAPALSSGALLASAACAICLNSSGQPCGQTTC